MPGSSLLEQQITLADIIDAAALERVCATFGRQLGPRLSVLEHTGRPLVAGELACEQALAHEVGQGAGCPLLEGTAVVETLRSSSEGLIDCPCGRRGGVARLDYQGHTLGYLVLGPFARPSAPQREGQVSASNGATLTEGEMYRALDTAREVFSVIVQTGYARHLTSQIHIAAIQDAYNELIEKNRRLADSVEKLKELDRLKNSFLATVSHELRTPLTSIIGYTEMLLEQVSGPLNEEQIQYLKTVMRKGDQLLQMINQILDISRTESGRIQLDYRDFDLCDVLRDVRDTMIPQARRKRVELVCQPPGGPLNMCADREKVRQILVNLLSNAIKFTATGGRVKVAAKTMSVDFGDGSRPAVELRVGDTGIGIAPKERHRVFEAFYQVDNSATRQHGGTGLGLALVKHFAEAHGGRTGVEDPAEGPGSEFVVMLPLGARSPDGALERSDRDGGGAAQTAVPSTHGH